MRVRSPKSVPLSLNQSIGHAAFFQETLGGIDFLAFTLLFSKHITATSISFLSSFLIFLPASCKDTYDYTDQLMQSNIISYFNILTLIMPIITFYHVRY